MKQTKAILQRALDEERRKTLALSEEIRRRQEFAKAESDPTSTFWNPRTATYVSLDKMATAMAKIVEEAVKLSQRR